MSSNKIIRGSFSRREMDVLNCMAQGLSNKEIAKQLSVSYETVRTHRKNINRKIVMTNFYRLLCEVADQTAF